MNIGIIVAMERELEALRAAGVEGARLAGIGKVNAAMTATEMVLKDRPDCIINSGVGGGLSPVLKAGDIVVGTSVAYHDVWCGEGNARGQVQGLPPRFDADPRLVDAAREACKEMPADAGNVVGEALGHLPGGVVHFGLIAGGDEFVDNSASEERIMGLYPDAIACDMESAAIAHVCHVYNVPFLCMRVVSDVAGAHTETYEGFWRDISGNSFAALKALLEQLRTAETSARFSVCK